MATDDDQRRLLLVRGPETWGEDWIGSRLGAIARDDLLWVAQRAAVVADPLPARRIGEALGGECGLLVFNAHQGFHPDAFAAAVGTLRGGGDCVVLLPEPAAWPDFADPDLARLTAYPRDAGRCRSPFLDRLLTCWGDAPGVIEVDADTPAARQPLPRCAPRPADTLQLTPDQAALVTAIHRVAEGHARRPLVVLADRGRGKSTALGVAARELLDAGLRRVTVVAPGRAAVATLYRHALRAPSASPALVRDVAIGGGELCFRLPQDLPDGGDEDLGLVLVDEAAALPVAVLGRLLAMAGRLVFATTVHGYEGSGRGFLLRFTRLLDAEMPQWRRHTLEVPVRWAADDPLERLLNRSLMLDAELPARDGEAGEPAIDRFPADALAADEALLRDLVGLLVNAHYQTRPSDLRQLLDNPDLEVFVARDAGGVLGVAVVLREGGFDPAMAAAILAGTRRPRGHLLPQSLAVHAGLGAILSLRTARVQRIAVHPAVRRRGIGRALLDAVAARAAHDGMQLVGCAFAADTDLLAFWLRLGFVPARVGLRSDPAAGAPSLFLLRGVDDDGAALAVDAARRFRHGLPWSLGMTQRTLDPAVALRLLRGRDCADLALDPLDRRDLGRLARGERPLLAGDHLAWRALVILAASDGALGDALAPALAWLLQGVSAQRVCRRWSLSGRAALEGVVRELLASMP